MKITDLYIDAFGIFRDCRMTELDPGLTILLGDNEAGKSTLLAFIRWMLLGQAPKRTKNDAPLEPLRGGKLAGQITLNSSVSGMYHLQRDAKNFQITDAAHCLMPEAAWLNLLQGMTPEAYKTIFAFSLAELQTFGNLQDPAVKDALYGAGAGISLEQLTKAAAVLEKTAKDLFLPSGKNPLLNKLYDALLQTRRKLAEAQKEWELYNLSQTQLQARQAACQESKNEVARLTAQKNRLERFLEAWDRWTAWQTVSRQLDQVSEPIPQFPEELEPRCREIRRLIEEKKQTLTESAAQREELKIRLQNDTISSELLEQAPALHALLEKKEQFRAYEKRMIELVREQAALQEQLERRRRGINPDARAQQLATIDTSLAAREALRRLAKPLAQHQQAADQAQQQLDRLQNEYAMHVEQIRGILEPLRYNQLTPSPPVEHLNDPPALLDFLTIQLQQLDIVQQRLDLYLSTSDECSQVARELEHQRQLRELIPPIEPRHGNSFLRHGLIFLRLLTVIICITLLLKNLWPYAAVTFLLYGFFEFLLYRLLHPRIPAPAIPGRAEQLEHAITQLAARQTQLQQQTEALGQTINLPHLKTESYPTLHDTVDNSRRGLAASLVELGRCYGQIGQVTRQCEDSRDAYTKALAAWEHHLLQIGLPQQLSPEAALAYLEQLSEYQSDLARDKALAGEREHIQAYLQAYRQELQRLRQAAAKPTAQADQAVALTNELFQMLQAEQAKQHDHDKNAAALLELTRRCESLAKSMAENNQTLHHYLQQAQAASVEEFDRRFSLYQQQQRMRTEIRQLERDLCQLTGFTDFTRLGEQLGKCDYQQLQAELEQVRFDLDAAVSRRDEALLEQGRLQKTLAQLADSQAVSRLRGEEAGLLEEMRRAAGQWSRARLAAGFIKEARQKFELEQQPEVARFAGEIFAGLTANRYQQLFVPVEEKTYYAIDGQGRRKNTEQLSRGTVEQLYLSLRLGFIRHYQKNHEPLPLVMDDILVNFDPARACRAAREIMKMAKENQVFYFTCHPEMVKIFEEGVDNSVSAEYKGSYCVYTIQDGILNKVKS